MGNFLDSIFGTHHPQISGPASTHQSPRQSRPATCRTLDGGWEGTLQARRTVGPIPNAHCWKCNYLKDGHVTGDPECNTVECPDYCERMKGSIYNDPDSRFFVNQSGGPSPMDDICQHPICGGAAFNDKGECVSYSNGTFGCPGCCGQPPPSASLPQEGFWNGSFKSV